MKHIALAMAVLLLTLTIAPNAQAMTCSGCVCDHITDGPFTANTNWAYSNWVNSGAPGASHVSSLTNTSCNIYSEAAANITNAASNVTQSFYVPSNGGSTFWVAFNVYAPNYGSATGWDTISWIVTDDLGRSETGTFWINSMSSCIGTVSVQLSNNYANRSVTLEIRKSRYS
ncbi:MAG TPA: hypothetical protein VF111_14745, partial [Thermoanaerobaculia bacterium]